MYLYSLSEKKKELVLDLFINTAKIDGVFADEERSTIDQYCVEMSIAKRYDTGNSFEETIENLVKISSAPDLKKILVELAALVLSDKKYEEREKELVDKYLESAGLTTSYAGRVFAAVENLYSVYADLAKLIK